MATEPHHQDNDSDPLALPPPNVLQSIAQRQNERAKEIKERRRRQIASEETEEIEDGRQRHAAEIIQRNFRGYRDRRVLKGHGIDPSTRWIDVRMAICDLPSSCRV